MAPGLTVDTSENGDVCVVALTGELALADAGTLEDRLGIGLRSGASRIIIDLAGVDFVDSTGLGVLVRAQQQAQDGNIEFGIVNPTAQVVRLLDLTGLAERLALPDSAATPRRPSDD